MTETVLEVKNLKTYFHTEDGVVPAVDDVTFSIPRGKTFGLVGESGCGKSVMAMSIIRLITPPGRIEGGQIVLHDGNAEIFLSELPESAMRDIRGSKIAMIFQEPMTSLNPVFTVGAQIREAIQLHQEISKDEAYHQAMEALRRVGIPAPKQRVDEYPHQFSGGMRQRAVIAMALSCHPELLIADEPTTALDVTVQAQILELLEKLQTDTGMAILMITHDLGVIAEIADEVAVMYASKIVERASTKILFARPFHPYTHALLHSMPGAGKSKNEKLDTIAGVVPSPLNFPSGCKFHPRCPFAEEECRLHEPELTEVVAGHHVRCHFAGKIDYV